MGRGKDVYYHGMERPASRAEGMREAVYESQGCAQPEINEDEPSEPRSGSRRVKETNDDHR
jgi:hypothetical protein